MEEERGLVRYFEVEDKRWKPTHMGFSNLLVKLDVENWEFTALNLPQDCLQGLDIYENTKGVYCIDGDDYRIREITAKECYEKAKKDQKEFRSGGSGQWN